MLPTTWTKLQPRPVMLLSTLLRRSAAAQRRAPKTLVMEPRSRPKTPEKESRLVRRKPAKALRMRLPSSRGLIAGNPARAGWLAGILNGDSKFIRYALLDLSEFVRRTTGSVGLR